LINKEKFYIPQDKIESYDGTVLRFKISEEDVRSEYLSDVPPPLSTSVGNDNINNNNNNNNIGDAKQKGSESESTRVPLIEEKLNVSKREVTYKEASLIKELVTETKTVKVPLTYEELIVERRPPTEATTSQHELKPPVTAREEIKIPLKERK
jgi:stress response protein YsnF